MNKTVLFTADIHGNEIQYQQLVNHAEKISADVIIIGGDIAPKDESENFIEMQEEFINNKIPKYMRSLKQKLPKSKTFMIMGNDDCVANLSELKDYDPELYQVIDKKRVNLGEGFDIVGYSTVPITPFSIKDWEKFDLTTADSTELYKEYEKRVRSNYNLEGVISLKRTYGKKEFVPFTLTEKDMKKSIQLDLKEPTFTKNPERTIHVMHCPPNNTNLDQIADGHVGSFAIREFIEKNQPYLTLHGHLHETVDVSGSFKDKIGKTLCMAPGNYNTSDKLAAIVFNLYEPEKAERIIIGE